METLEFSEVDYWAELSEIMEWSKSHVYSTLHICWAAQAGLYYHYGIPKIPTPKKVFGVFAHQVLDPSTQLTRGFDDLFYAPHSRHTTLPYSEIEKHPALRIIAASPEAGAYLIFAKGGRQIFVTGHAEYDRDTLKSEYDRDIAKGMDMQIPCNYYPGDDPAKTLIVRWRGHAICCSATGSIIMSIRKHPMTFPPSRRTIEGLCGEPAFSRNQKKRTRSAFLGSEPGCVFLAEYSKSQDLNCTNPVKVLSCPFKHDLPLTSVLVPLRTLVFLQSVY